MHTESAKAEGKPEVQTSNNSNIENGIVVEGEIAESTAQVGAILSVDSSYRAEKQSGAKQVALKQLVPCSRVKPIFRCRRGIG